MTMPERSQLVFAGLSLALGAAVAAAFAIGGRVPDAVFGGVIVGGLGLYLTFSRSEWAVSFGRWPAVPGPGRSR
ncbi:MAG: hypothetical protein ACR2H3_15210 [Acidimicrobiales bacterium]